MAHPSLTDRSVIVTGGSRGIGREIVLALAEAGARVAVVGATDSEHLADTIAAARAFAGERRILPVVGDLRRREDCDRIAHSTLDAFGSIEVLFNNAALGMPTIVDSANRTPPVFWQADPETWIRLVDTNINGVFLATRAVVPAMLAQGFGKVVNLSTNGRTMVRAQGSPYGPSKAFVEAASRVWAQDLAGTGVTVNVLLPGGAVDTSRPGAAQTASSGRFLPVTVMRAPALWLASDLSNQETGARFVARLWDEALPLIERALAAREETTDLPRII
jgi:NAD(P)-dependent dehydrogenase (short-subunit alcohol dehydrogenase family)